MSPGCSLEPVVDEVRADEAGRAGDEDAHGAHRTRRLSPLALLRIARLVDLLAMALELLRAIRCGQRLVAAAELGKRDARGCTRVGLVELRRCPGERRRPAAQRAPRLRSPRPGSARRLVGERDSVRRGTRRRRRRGRWRRRRRSRSLGAVWRTVVPGSVLVSATRRSASRSCRLRRRRGSPRGLRLRSPQLPSEGQPTSGSGGASPARVGASAAASLVARAASSAPERVHELRGRLRSRSPGPWRAPAGRPRSSSQRKIRRSQTTGLGVDVGRRLGGRRCPTRTGARPVEELEGDDAERVAVARGVARSPCACSGAR